MACVILRAMFTSRSKQFVAWIALFAFFHAAATPLFASLRVQSQPLYYGALCTMGGIEASPAQPAVPSESGATSQLHCVFCVGGAWQPPLDIALAVPAPAATGLVVSGRRDGVSRFPLAALQPLSPRAPPRLV